MAGEKVYISRYSTPKSDGTYKRSMAAVHHAALPAKVNISLLGQKDETTTHRWFAQTQPTHLPQQVLCGHVGAYGQPSLDLSFHVHHLLPLFGRKDNTFRDPAARSIDCGDPEHPQCFAYVRLVGNGLETHPCKRFTDPHYGLQLTHCDGNRRLTTTLLRRFFDLLANSHVLVLKDARCCLRQTRSASGSSILDESFHEAFVCSPPLVKSPVFFGGLLVHSYNMPRDLYIAVEVSLVFHNEDQVEARKNGALQVNILFCCLQVIISSRRGICSCQNSSTRVQHGGNASLSDGNSLLFHRFVNCYTIFRSHLVKLVNTNNAAIC
mmetsp:Transcript_11244/g.69441  ORF Transcript_11244/g.69441 Transcript_11244/m.69441 type:complete len:323 (+) Transcript_11244:51-1019(+)